MSADHLDWIVAIFLALVGSLLGFERWKGRRETSETTVNERMATAKERHMEDVARLDKEIHEICTQQIPALRQRQHQLASELQIVNIKVAIIETRLGGKP